MDWSWWDGVNATLRFVAIVIISQQWVPSTPSYLVLSLMVLGGGGIVSTHVATHVAETLKLLVILCVIHHGHTSRKLLKMLPSLFTVNSSLYPSSFLPPPPPLLQQQSNREAGLFCTS